MKLFDTSLPYHLISFHPRYRPISPSHQIHTTKGISFFFLRYICVDLGLDPRPIPVPKPKMTATWNLVHIIIHHLQNSMCYHKTGQAYSMLSMCIYDRHGRFVIDTEIRLIILLKEFIQRFYWGIESTGR